jgi:UPF0042 nucleotide-binding protein
VNLFIVSGLSGSGKSIALQALEDLGFYCIDNLPAVLLPLFATELMERSEDGHTDAAVSIDSRNRGFLKTLSENLEQIERLGLDCKIIFLEASESVLIKRFSETRRSHPLTDEDTPLVEGIRREKELLTPVSANATRHIDTSNTTPHELRALVRDFAGGVSQRGLSLLFQSFGYKHGAPLDADFVFDVRCLPNPYWKPDLRALTGKDSAVIAYLQTQTQVDTMINQIGQFLDNWLPSFDAEHRSYITVAIGCTGGQHRSVYIADRLSDHFAGKRINVHVRHRELS